VLCSDDLDGECGVANYDDKEEVEEEVYHKKGEDHDEMNNLTFFSFHFLK